MEDEVVIIAQSSIIHISLNVDSHFIQLTKFFSKVKVVRNTINISITVIYTTKPVCLDIISQFIAMKMIAFDRETLPTWERE